MGSLTSDPYNHEHEIPSSHLYCSSPRRQRRARHPGQVQRGQGDRHELLDDNKIGVNLSEQMDTAMAQAQARIEEANLKARARAAEKQARQALKNRLAKVENRELRKTLKNLFKTLESEARKAIEA